MQQEEARRGGDGPDVGPSVQETSTNVSAEGDGLPSYLRSTEPEPGPPCYKVVRSADRGRYVVATRFIPAGSVILSEEPIMLCPGDPEKPGHLTCLGCCTVVRDAVACSGCGGPLCGAPCETSPYHLPECEAMQGLGKRFTVRLRANEYELLAFLRVLLLNGHDASARRRLEGLESHKQSMLANPVVRMQMESLAPGLVPPLRRYSTEERCWAYGVVETNVFCYSERLGGREAVVLLDDISMICHSCVCNAFGHCYNRPEDAKGWAAMDGLRKVVVAATDIKAGEEITVSYTHPHLSTPARVAELEQSKQFTCRCRRCKDPAELGLNTNALCCETCKAKGHMELPVPEGGRNKWWRCPRCKCRSPPPDDMVLGSLEMEISRYHESGDAKALEALLARSLFPRGRFHPTHELVLDAQYYLTAQMYGQMPGLALSELRAEQLQSLRVHCRDYLRAAGIAEPGYGLRMARVNMSLAGANLEVVKRCEKLPTTAATLAAVAEAEQCLQAAEVALRCSSDARPQLRELRERTEHARRLVGPPAELSTTKSST